MNPIPECERAIVAAGAKYLKSGLIPACLVQYASRMGNVTHDELSPEDVIRLKLLRSAPLNSWVALSEDETHIVAAGATLDDVVEQCNKAGISNPLLLKTPEEWLPFAL